MKQKSGPDRAPAEQVLKKHPASDMLITSGRILGRRETPRHSPGETTRRKERDISELFPFFAPPPR